MEAFSARIAAVAPPLRHHAAVRRRSAMSLPTLHRITTVVTRSNRNPIQSCLTTTTHPDLRFDSNLNRTMADSDAKNQIKSGDGSSGVKDTKEQQKLPEMASPPEKPLPGDCCGSGCVRCVWEVYYDELEEYNKVKSGSEPATGSKVS